MHTMRLELEEAKSKEAQLMADLATAGELTQEISRLVNTYLYTRYLLGAWVVFGHDDVGKKSRGHKKI